MPDVEDARVALVLAGERGGVMERRKRVRAGNMPFLAW